jgi:hypothetical protein
MSTILYARRHEQEPNFPAADQHPEAKRYRVGQHWVDAVGGKPTKAELDAFLAPPPPAPSVEERLAALEAKAGE